jgi:hypothetical protein
VFPALSLRRLIFTVAPAGHGHAGYVDTNAIRVEAPRVFNAAAECAWNGVPLT